MIKSADPNAPFFALPVLPRPSVAIQNPVREK